ncbi:MAG: (2Fe-2S)-binding protein [Planctomycetota bacterium]|jgi:NAD(P)H-nitrite reductase large subunit
MGPDDTICFCFHVPQRKIERFVERERPKRASQISECLSAGTGCGWCIPMLKQIHQRVLDPSEVEEAAALSPKEYEARRRRYLKTGRRGGDA